MSSPFLPPNWTSRAAEVCRDVEALVSVLQTEADRRAMPAGAGALEDTLAALQSESVEAGERADRVLARVALGYRQMIGLLQLSSPPSAAPDAYIQTIGGLLSVGVEAAALVFSPSLMSEFRAGADPTIAESVEFRWAKWLDVLSGYVEEAHCAASAIAVPGGRLQDSLSRFEAACRRMGSPKGGGEEHVPPAA